MTNDKASNMPQSMQSKPLQSPDKGRQTHENSEKSHETKPKKAQKTKREKNEIVHYVSKTYMYMYVSVIGLESASLCFCLSACENFHCDLPHL